MVDLRPDRLTTYQSERKLVVSRRPGVTLCSLREVNRCFGGTYRLSLRSQSQKHVELQLLSVSC
jgi:hypothetical protein